jgi:hypothetical protein
MKRRSGQLVIALLMLTIPFMVGAHDKSSKSSKKSKPVFITDQPISVVDVSPRQSFQNQEIERGGDAVFVVFINEVPVGVRLVMQHVSLSGKLFNDDLTDPPFAECSLVVITNELVETRLKLAVAVERRRDDDYIAEGPITFYANAGDSVQARCNGFYANDEVTSSISLIGTLVGEFVPVGD